MPAWQPAIAIASDGSLPIFLRIARAIAEDVRRGRLRPGDRLPGSRRLAEMLGVHRNTALGAYRELMAEGWIVTEPARGTFVSAELPEAPARRATRRAPPVVPPARSAFGLHGASAPPRESSASSGLISLTGGLPDLGLVPTDVLGRAYRRALKGAGRGLLEYGDPRGHVRLREALATMLASTRGVVTDRDGILLTRGSQMALYLVARVLLAPGETVAVEAYGYRPAWESFRQAGARLVPVPVDREGLRVDALEEAIARAGCRAVYLTPHHQYPTTVTLSPGRRLSLMELARKTGIAIIEDDYDHEFHYAGRPVLPLASADPHGVVVYVGTLSKVFAPGMRLGYVVAPAPTIERLSRYRSYVDHHGDQVVEAALAELIEEGDLSRHVNRARRIYAGRRDAFVALLQRKLGDVLTFRTPPGGMALWAKVSRQVDVDVWAERALARGVAIAPARRFTFDGKRRPWVRLGFARADEAQLGRAVDTLAGVV